jgi:hypothetical protein
MASLTSAAETTVSRTSTSTDVNVGVSGKWIPCLGGAQLGAVGANSIMHLCFVCSSLPLLNYYKNPIDSEMQRFTLFERSKRERQLMETAGYIGYGVRSIVSSADDFFAESR